MMKTLLTLNKALLFACVSMYFGTGWSLVLFSFPIASELTPDNYYMQFIPQVTAATHFLTYMTIVMMVCCLIFIIEKWKSASKWYPIIVLAAVIAATALTEIYILPYNEQMAKGITDAAALQQILHKWMQLNIIRTCIWSLQWLTMTVYYSTRTIYPQHQTPIK